MQQWLTLLQQYWSYLVSGQKLDVTCQVPHPSLVSEFSRTVLAEAHGQVVDWELPLTDGSRIHVHEFADGRLVVHRDAINPSRGPIEAVLHWLTETGTGAVVLAGGLVLSAGVGIAVVANALGGGKKPSRSR